MFLTYLLQNPTDSDKIWYTLSGVNLLYRNVNVFHFTGIMSLHYLVKVSIHVVQVNSNWNCEPQKHTKIFCHIFYKNETDSDEI